MRPIDNIKKMIKKLHTPASPHLDERIHSEISNATAETKNKKMAQFKPNVWRTIMSNRITKFAAAAVIIIAVLIGINRFVNLSSPAFAKVLEQVKKAKSVYYKTTLQFEDQFYSREMMINEDGVQRLDIGQDTVLIFDFKNGVNLTLHTNEKKGYRTVSTPRPEWRTFNSLDFLATHHEKGLQFVGYENVDGIETEVYKDLQPLNFSVTTIWVDPKFNLPIRVESETIPPEDPCSFVRQQLLLDSRDFNANSNESASLTLSGHLTPPYMKEVMTDFKWNVDLDSSLFNTDVPADYAVRYESAQAEPNETHLIESLKFWSEMSGGLLPSNITVLMDPNKVKAMLIEKFSESQDYHQAVEFAKVISYATSFVEGKIMTKNWYVSIEPVYLGEADKPFCWWKQENINEYRVIFGDLSVRTIPAEELAELP